MTGACFCAGKGEGFNKQKVLYCFGEVVLKKDKVEETEAKVKDGQEEVEKVDSGIGSSQLSIYSMDAESRSFSQPSTQVTRPIANVVPVLTAPFSG